MEIVTNNNFEPGRRWKQREKRKGVSSGFHVLLKPVLTYMRGKTWVE
jgi:hypothetical protein